MEAFVAFFSLTRRFCSEGAHRECMDTECQFRGAWTGHNSVHSAEFSTTCQNLTGTMAINEKVQHWVDTVVTTRRTFFRQFLRDFFFPIFQVVPSERV